MNKINPIGYSKKSMGIFLAVAIAVGTLLLTFLLVKGGANFSDMKYFCIIAGVLALLCVISDFTTNRKNKTKIAHMQYMLSCPSVAGEVSEPYSRNVASYVNDNNVAVHYSQDGEYWIEI
jgi:hypothetical protein